MTTPTRIIAFFLLVLPASAQLALIRQGRDSRGTPEEEDWHGAAVALGDFNGDGYDDLVTGAPFEASNPSTRPSGAVIVSPGTPWGLTWKDALYLTPLDASLATDEAHHMGAALAAGDFNGDGFDDLAVGLSAPGDPEFRYSRPSFPVATRYEHFMSFDLEEWFPAVDGVHATTEEFQTSDGKTEVVISPLPGLLETGTVVFRAVAIHSGR